MLVISTILLKSFSGIGLWLISWGLPDGIPLADPPKWCGRVP